jgi:hypothetical protein
MEHLQQSYRTGKPMELWQDGYPNQVIEIDINKTKCFD